MTGAGRQATFLAQLFAREGTEHEIQLIRELAADEAEAIAQAHRLVLGMSRAEAFNRCVELHDLIQKRLGEVAGAETPTRRQLEGLQSAFASLAVALDGLATDLSGRVGEDAAFTAAAKATRESRPWADVAAVGDREAGGIQRRRADGGIVWRRDRDGEVISLIGLAAVATQFAERLLVEAFRALGDEITDAATRLRRLSVEAPEGFPGLIDLTVVDGTPALNRFTPRPLAIDRVSEVLRAVRIARGLDRGQAPEGEYTAEPEPEPAPEPEAEPQSPEPEGPVEMSALFRLARTLFDDLEHAWSAALDEVRVRAALTAQAATTMSLLHALQREVAGDEDPIEEWPLSLQGVLELELAAARHTDRLAQLDALARVIRNLEVLGGRTSVRISFGDDGAQDRVERFWDSGAFGALRDTLFLLERLSPERDPRREGFERLQAGARALVHGDPEAALSHAVLAAASILDVPLADVPAQAAERTLEGPARRPFTRQIFERAIELVRAAAEGRPNAAAALFLAPTALRATEALLHAPLPGPNLSGPELADLIDAEDPLESFGDA